jgi:Ni,Fe-hydrogenase maturation factor
MEENEMKTVVLCFGNEYVDFDKLPLTLSKELEKEFPKIEFVNCETPNQIMDYVNYNIIILDIVKGIKKIQIIEDFDKIKTRKIFTLHDFDLGLFLKIIKKVEKIDNIKIIGIPMNYKKEKAKSEIKKLLNNL